MDPIDKPLCGFSDLSSILPAPIPQVDHHGK